VADLPCAALASHDYDNTEIRVVWHDWVKSPEVERWLDTTPGFRDEVSSFGSNLLNTLISP
jgi:hypothetical protein